MRVESGKEGMSALVLDCSLTMSWFFKDEAAPESYDIQRMVMQDGAVVPTVWPYEVGNAFCYAEKRSRLTREETEGHLEFLSAMAISIDDESGRAALNKTIVFSRSHNLTVYDAAYLELALRRALPLATKDHDLRKAAHKLGIKTLPAK